MLTDAERDRFVIDMDAKTAEAEAASAWWRARGDKYQENQFHIRSTALRMVALIYRAEQVKEAAN